MTQETRGAVLSYLNVIVTMIGGLLLTPFIIRALGDSNFGVYTLIGSMVAYLTVLDLGMNNSVVRFVAKYRAEKDPLGEENFLAVAMTVYGGVVFLLAAIGGIIYSQLERLFGDSLSTTQLDDARIMTALLILNLAITLPGGAFAAICSAYRHFAWPRTMTLIRYLMRIIIVLSVLSMGGKAISLVVIDTLLNAIMILANIVFVFFKLRVRFRFHRVTIILMKDILSYSLWSFVLVLVGLLQWNAAQVIIGVISNPVDVAIYSVGIMLGGIYAAFGSAIIGVLLPGAMGMIVANAEGRDLTNRMIAIGRLLLVINLFVLAGFALFGRQFITLWVGGAYHEAYAIALIIMIAATIPIAQGFANALLEARAAYAVKAVSHIVSISVGTAIGAWILMPSIGLKGVAIGAAGGWMTGVAVVNVYYRRRMQLEIGRFFAEVARGILPALILTLLVGGAIASWPGASWISLAAKATLFSATYALFMIKVGMTRDEIRRMHALLSKPKSESESPGGASAVQVSPSEFGGVY